MTLTAHIKAFAKLLLFGGMILLCAQSYSQLHIPEHTLLRLDEDLVSQEEYNYINTSITGTAKLVFNVGRTQYLDSSSDHINLTNLSILNTSLQINSSFTVKGDVLITSSYVHITKPLYIQGELLFDNKSTIEGFQLINQDIAVPAHFPFKTIQIVKAPIFSTSYQVKEDAVACIIHYNISNPGYVEYLKDSAFLTTPSPPPKQSC